MHWLFARNTLQPFQLSHPLNVPSFASLSSHPPVREAEPLQKEAARGLHASAVAAPVLQPMASKRLQHVEPLRRRDVPQPLLSNLCSGGKMEIMSYGLDRSCSATGSCKETLIVSKKHAANHTNPLLITTIQKTQRSQSLNAGNAHMKIMTTSLAESKQRLMKDYSTEQRINHRRACAKPRVQQ
jgi:hypothetical protein